MAQITTGAGIALEYETFGSPADPPLLMVPGFGMQLIEWPSAFCELLAAGGRYVISCDNRRSRGRGPHELHFHDLRHTRNTLAAATGTSLGDLLKEQISGQD